MKLATMVMRNVTLYCLKNVSDINIMDTDHISSKMFSEQSIIIQYTLEVFKR